MIEVSYRLANDGGEFYGNGIVCHIVGELFCQALYMAYNPFELIANDAFSCTNDKGAMEYINDKGGTRQ